MSFVEKAKTDKERFEKAMEDYEVKSKAKKDEVLRAKRWVLKLKAEEEDRSNKKPLASKTALEHFAKLKRKKIDDAKSAWDALSTKERNGYNKIAQKDSKRFKSEQKEFQRRQK